MIFLERILYIVYPWRTQRANLVIGTLANAAAGTKCATSASLLAYEYVHCHYHRYADLIVVLQPLLATSRHFFTLLM